jgi:CubicO group peptidase (beta-lactamase class C family)
MSSPLRVPVGRWIALVVAISVAAACSGSDETAESSVAATTATAPTTVAATDTPTTTAATTTVAPTTTETTTPPTTEAAVEYDFSAVGPIVQDFVDANGLNGAALVVVDRDNGIVDEQYFGEFTPNRVSLIASSSKMLVAGVLLHLADEGLLDIDAPVADAVDWGSGNPTITPAQLVSNSSGLVGLFPNAAYGPYVCQFLPVGTMQDCVTGLFNTPDDDADIIPPDTEFRYGGAQWQVAGALAEDVTGKSWAELMDEVYVEPCDAPSLGFNNHFTQLGTSGFDYPSAFDGDPSVLADTDNPNMEGGAFTNPVDYAKILWMLLRGGTCGETQVLSQESVDRMLADRIGEAYDGNSMPGSGYGLGWWIERSTGRASDPGAYGAYPWISPDRDHAAFLVIEADSTLGASLAAQLFEPVAEAIAAR